MGYKVCPFCGANLDPGEICDCKENEDAPDAAGTSSKYGCAFDDCAIESVTKNGGEVNCLPAWRGIYV